jgi:peptidylprolyl isomerase
MATTKRERQKAARRDKMERLQRESKRRQTVRRWVIISIVGAMVLGTGAALFSGGSSTTTTTIPTTTTTLAATTTTLAQGSTTTTGAVTTSTIAATVSTFAPIPAADRSAPGKSGSEPTVTVPTSAAPTQMLSSDLIAGTGAAAKAGDTLQMQYVLATYSTHKVQQSSWTSAPFSFKLGAGQVIKGWDLGIVGMREGGRRELIIPASLGYGAQSPGNGIAANDTLVFVVDLLKVTKG